MLESVNIKNFRGFEDLALAGLGRVNLVVGKNNTGKTSLLEAITVVADPGSIDKLPGLYRANAGAVAERFYSWLLKDSAAGANTAFLSAGAQRRLALQPSQNAPEGYGNQLWTKHGFALWSKGGIAPLPVHAVSVQHRTPDSMVDAFAEAVRAPADEKRMEECLRAVDPRVRSIRLDALGEKPFIVVDVGLSQRVPLSQAGQGLYRLVGIFSELLGGKPKVCLIDEVENGIHHSALPQVWTGIAAVAELVDVQVFATTHSWECLVAAHEAFGVRKDYDLRVLQLYRIAERTDGRVLGCEHIQAAIAGEIELR